MVQSLSRAVSKFGKLGVIKIVLIGALIYVFARQGSKLLAFFRSRLQGAVIGNDVLKKVAQDSNTSAATVKTLVREEHCKGVASSVFAALHEKPGGFLPRSIFGSTENESEIIRQLNSLANGSEAKFVSSYYVQKYGNRLNGLLIKYMSSSEYKQIRPEISNNLN